MFDTRLIGEYKNTVEYRYQRSDSLNCMLIVSFAVALFDVLKDLKIFLLTSDGKREVSPQTEMDILRLKDFLVMEVCGTVETQNNARFRFYFQMKSSSVKLFIPKDHIDYLEKQGYITDKESKIHFFDYIMDALDITAEKEAMKRASAGCALRELVDALTDISVFQTSEKVIFRSENFPGIEVDLSGVCQDIIKNWEVTKMIQEKAPINDNLS